jgi:hypothetical protein
MYRKGRRADRRAGMQKEIEPRGKHHHHRE